MYFCEGVEYWNARRIWCLTKSFFSHFVYVVFAVEFVDKECNLAVCLFYHWLFKWHVVVFVV